MSWVADVAFAEFVGQFEGWEFSSAQHYRQRHMTAAMAGAFFGLAKILGR